MKLLTAFLDLLFPIECVGCGKEGSYCCANCFTRIQPLPKRFIPSDGTMAFDGIFAYGPHEEKSPLTKLIHLLKYESIRGIAEMLAPLLAQAITASPEAAKANITSRGIIIPIPLHRLRKNHRGFNQCELLAEGLARQLHLPCANLLVRKRSTRPQVKLSRRERLTNLQGAFSFSHTETVLPQNSVCLVVDDVATTGGTLHECAKILKQHGASRVYGVVAARKV